MIIRAKLKFAACGSGDIALDIYAQDEESTVSIPTYRFSVPDHSFYDFNSNACCHTGPATVVIPLRSSKSYSEFKDWYGKTTTFCRSDSSLAIEALQVAGFPFNVPFFSTSFCCTINSKTRFCSCFLPTCGCNSPNQVFTNIVIPIAQSQISVNEDWFNRFIAETQESLKDITRKQFSATVLPDLINHLKFMSILFENKASTWKSNIPPLSVSDTVILRGISFADTVSKSNVATDKAAFAEFEKKFFELLSKEINNKTITEIEAKYLKNTVIDHLATRNKAMIAFISQREKIFAGASTIPFQNASSLKPTPTKPAEIKMLR